MAMLRSFITLLWLIMHSLAIPFADDDDNDDGGDDDDCASGTPQLAQLVVSTSPATHVPDSPSAAILYPYERRPTPYPYHSQHPHATLPVSHRSHTPAIFGAVFGIMTALFAFSLIARYVFHRRRIAGDPFKDPSKPGFIAFRLRKSATYEKRLSDESWVSPPLPSFTSPGSPLSQDLELRRYALPQRRLVPVTTPVCTPTDTEFGPRLESADGDPGSPISVTPVRVPSPVYIPPFPPSPSLSSSPPLSPTPSTEPLGSPTTNPARLSRLLSSTFRDSRTYPVRPTTAHLIQTARSYAHAYRRSSMTNTSLYTPPTPPGRLAGTRSRAGFYPTQTDQRAGMRDTLPTVTTADTDTVCTVPHLLHGVSEVQLSASPFSDPVDGDGPGDTPSASASPFSEPSVHGEDHQMRTPVGTPLGLKLRLSDASEHALYRSRERQRERERQQTREGQRKREREVAEQRLSTDSQTSATTAMSMETVRASHPPSQSLDMDEVRQGFKLRDSESVLREFGW